MSTSDILESLIEKDNGYLITSKAVESGVSKPSVSKYVREHDMEKVAHGIYILDNVSTEIMIRYAQKADIKSDFHITGQLM